MSDTHITWGLGIMATSILGLYGIFVKMIIDKKKDGNDGSNIDNLVTKDVCAQTQQLVEQKIAGVAAEVTHVREIVARVEQGQTDKHKSLTEHINSKFEQMTILIKQNGNRQS